MLWWQYFEMEKCKCHGLAGALCFCDSSCLPILAILFVILRVSAVVAFCHCCHDIIVEAKNSRNHNEATTKLQ